MTRTKVFVGNLSFKTKREELAAEFQAAGRVVEANIITRGTRSLGYGFVEMESEEDAQKAINIMNKKSIDSREINVELAKPRDETKIGERRPAPQRRNNNNSNRRPNNPSGGGNATNNNQGGAGGANNNNAGNNNNNNNNSGGNASGNRNNRPPRNNNQNKANNAGSSSSSDSSKDGGSSNNAGSPATSAKDGDKTPGARRFRPRRYRRRFPRKDHPPRKESETSLFIANLPFSIDSQALSDMYKAHNVKSAHVVANRNGKSKGFGFVELATQADQKAALDATNKINVQGRELIVKIALTPVENPKEAQSDNQANKDEQKN